MEGPGMSLFQGAASIHINNSAQDRLEEQEELEDQKRRDEELKKELDNGFDDLHDDDDASSVNSSGNFTLDAAQSNGIQGQPQSRAGLPPTYVESLNHLKDVHHAGDSPKPYCETPKNQHKVHHQEDPVKLLFSPYGAGDGQNHYHRQEYRVPGHANGINNYDDRQEYMNHEKLKVLYEMRVKECEQFAVQIKKLDMEVESLRARLAAAVNDRDKTDGSLQEAHHLLASSKHKLINLEQQVTALTEKMAENDQEKDQLKAQLRSSNLNLQEVQQRLQTMQVAHTHDTDALFRDLQDRHREETERLQTDLMKLKSRLDEKDSDTKILERKCMEKDREKEEILIEKSATVNRLLSELEAAQSRLCSGEMVKLKDQVIHLTREKNTAREQVKELGSKLEQTAHELVLCRNKYSASQEEYKNWKTTLYQIMLESVPDKSYLGEPSSPVKLATLKDILSKYKLQMQKASTLQEEITKRDKKIDLHRKHESDLRTKLEEQKAVEMQLNSRIAVLQNKLELLGSNSDSELIESYKHHNEQLQHELEQIRAEMKTLDLKYTELEMDHDKLRNEKGSRASIVQEANADLLRELEKYSTQLKDTLKENGELKTLYLQACSSRDSVSRELKNEQTKMQKEREYFKSQEKDYVERLENEKQNIAKLSAELSSSKEELEKANKRISELQKEFTDKQKEFADRLNKYLEDEKNAIRKEIEPCSQCEKQLNRVRTLEEQLNKCNVRLATHEGNETLMQELKGKAEFFQQYIIDRFKKLNEQRTIGTNTEDYVHQNGDCHDEKEHSGDEEIASKTALMMKEKAIRDQIAEKFTLEMKTMEMDCARKVKELENEHLTAIAKLKELLERKAKEVETLKDFILAEREKVTSILESKENEISVLIKDHNELQSDLQKAKDHILEWKVKAEKYKEKLTRYSSVEEALKSEREDLKQRYAKEWQTAKSKMSDLQTKMAQIQQKYDVLLVEHKILQEKYKNVKKTVFTYRDYMAKKDVHVNSEISRIQDEYRKIFVNLQNQINYYVSLRVQEEERARSSKTPDYMQQYDYTEKMKMLNEEFAKLSQLDPNASPENEETHMMPSDL